MSDRRVLMTLVVALTAVLAGCDDAPGPAAVMEVESPALSVSVVSAGPALGLKPVATGLTQPVTMAEPPDGSGRLFVVDQTGVIRIVDASGALLAAPFLDVRAKMVVLNPRFDERGLLGLAFHPAYAENGRFYVYYSAPPRLPDYNHTTRIAEYTVSSDPDLADPTSERVLLEIDQPQFNHNAGTLKFGPADGYLYISVGDGGGAHDVGFGHVEDWYEVNDGGNGQDITKNLLGNILRIDVDGGTPYGIPADNPFVGERGLDEIWAFGFRNPYRFSFDQGGSHALLAGDAGQHLYEEVDVVEGGGNYGWNVKEGPVCFSTEHPREPLDECPDSDPDGRPLIDPVIAYANAAQPDGLGLVVIGGYVYRGDDVPQLSGRYVFGDFSSAFFPPDGLVFIAQPRPSGPWHIQEVSFPQRDGRLGEYLLGFGQDAEGEVYVLTTETAGPRGTSGKVYRLTQPGTR
ncbi:MAG: PQQ-dependent sugar dehydrogenase [Gemmatimonadetes bacterium]|nr:PQQ-dependent sugar dehydrogenase [Gemmatimonadota bacterium]